jgi:hypothetical protein
MRKSVTLILLALLASTSFAIGQNKVWSVGPEIGVNFSRYGMDANRNDHLPGIVGGFFATYSVINTFGVTGKILYSEKGSEQKDYDEILRYIEIPLTARFFINKEGRFRPNLFAGSSAGYLLHVSRRDNDGNMATLQNFEDLYNRFDLGITGGIGLNYEIIEDTRVLIDGRYTYGLRDLTKAAGQINNETFTATVGLSFGL